MREFVAVQTCRFVNFSIYHQLPFVAVLVLYVVVLLAALEIGYRLGIRKHDDWKGSADDVGKLFLTSLFGVLGLMLAFSFGSGVSFHKTRKQAIVQEANALGTAYLRAGLVDDPGRSELRRVLLAYAHTRVAGSREIPDAETLRKLIEESWRAKAKLWPVTEEILRESEKGPIGASLAAAVNNVLDADTIRVAAIVDCLPPVVLTMLLLIAAATVSVAGFNAGLSGRISRWRATILCLVVAAIMLVILDFDRPITGFIRVSNESIRAVIAEMEAGLGSSGPR